MTVKELIEELSKIDQNYEVSTTYDCSEIMVYDPTKNYTFVDKHGISCINNDTKIFITV